MKLFDLQNIDLLGNSSIGIFGLATDQFALLPTNTKETVIKIARDVLQVPVVQANLVFSQLLGLYAVANSHTLLLPHLISNEEYDYLREHIPSEIGIEVLESRITALGNTIAVSDKIAVVHPEFKLQEKKVIADALDVEVVAHNFTACPLVGSILYQTQHGLLAHPNITDDELDWVLDTFVVQGDITTVNRGTPYPHSGIIANSFGGLVGSDTTGPEMMRIFEILSPKH